MLTANILVALAGVAERHRRSLANMFYVSTFTDVTGLISLLAACVSLLLLGTGAALLILGLVKHRKGLWITGLVLGLVALLALTATLCGGAYYALFRATEDAVTSMQEHS
jgi:hypothetical protein